MSKVLWGREEHGGRPEGGNAQSTHGGRSASILVTPTLDCVPSTKLSVLYESSPLNSHNPLGHRDDG